MKSKKTTNQLIHLYVAKHLFYWMLDHDFDETTKKIIWKIINQQLKRAKYTQTDVLRD